MTPSVVWQFKPAARRSGSRLTWFQSWLFTRTTRNVVAVAARRSGKTVGIRAKIIEECMSSTPGDVGYMAPTLGQAKRLLWRPLMRDLRDPASKHFIEGKPNHSELTVEFRSGTRLYLYSAEAAERVRGDGFKAFFTDETDDPIFTDDIFDEAVGPALADNRGRLYQLGTPKGRGRLYREFRKGQPHSPAEVRDLDYESIQVTAIEAGIIDKAEIERARRTRPARAFAQEYMAQFNAPIGLVYDEWNDERHIVTAGQTPAFDDLDEVIVGVDWGTARRGAMIVMGIDRVYVKATDDYDECELSRVWILEEHSHAGVPYSDAGWWKTARQIQRQWRPTRWYCDPAGGSEGETEARAAGYLRQLDVVLADECGKASLQRTKVIAGDNRVSLGISAVQEYLHYDDVLGEKPRLRVLDTCPITIGEFQGYRWGNDPKSDEEDAYEDKPVKRNDHCLDATRYALYTRFYSHKQRRGRNADQGHEARGG